jgi:3-hydroxyisobutyrate dehydrogenase
MKLLGNLFLMMFTAGMTEALALAKQLDVPIAELATLFENFNPGATLPQRFARVSNGDYATPSWELAMARKDARLMIEAGNGQLAVLPALAAEMDRWIAAGHGKDDWTVIAKQSVS